MSNTTATATATNASPKTNKAKRASYGFALDFPATFTLRDLRKQKSHKVKYITLYMRVKKGLADGTIVPTGVKMPTKARRGRKELVFSRVDAKTAIANEVVSMADLAS